jgi:hypothetical protein
MAERQTEDEQSTLQNPDEAGWMRDSKLGVTVHCVQLYYARDMSHVR